MPPLCLLLTIRQLKFSSNILQQNHDLVLEKTSAGMGWTAQPGGVDGSRRRARLLSPWHEVQRWTEANFVCVCVCVHSGAKIISGLKISKAADLKTGQVMLSGTKTVSRTTIFGFGGLCFVKVTSASWRVRVSVSSGGSHGSHDPTVPTYWRPFPGVFSTRRRSGGGRGWSSLWPGSCFLSCLDSVCSWSSSAELAAPWTRTERTAGSRAPPGRRSSRRSGCSRTGTLRITSF